ncbi:hypothetical protein ScPMuIL_003996 [Solemya velum]
MRLVCNGLLTSLLLLFVAGYEIAASDLRCRLKIPNGELRHDCFSRLFRRCSYKCSPGFNENRLIKHITCMENGWGHNLYSLCIEKNNIEGIPVCPLTLAHGSLVNGCSREAGVLCDYNCDNGYKKPDPEAGIQCSLQGAWHMSQPCTMEGRAADVSSKIWIGAAIASIPVLLVALFIWCARKKRSRSCSQEFGGQTPPRGMTTAEYSEVQSLNLGEATISRLPQDPLIASRYKQQLSHDPSAPPTYEEAVLFQEVTEAPPSYSHVIEYYK